MAEAKCQRAEQKLRLAVEAAQQADEAAVERARQLEHTHCKHKRVIHCKRCHRDKNDKHTRVLNVKTGKWMHDCTAKRVPPCDSFDKCGYASGHSKELAAWKKVARLEAQRDAAAAAAEEEVCFRLCVCL